MMCCLPKILSRARKVGRKDLAHNNIYRHHVSSHSPLKFYIHQPLNRDWLMVGAKYRLMCDGFCCGFIVTDLYVLYNACCIKQRTMSGGQ